MSREWTPYEVVGATGFEPATLCSQSRCATRLRYAPTEWILRHSDCGGRANRLAGAAAVGINKKGRLSRPALSLNDLEQGSPRQTPGLSNPPHIAASVGCGSGPVFELLPL
jgi:hypothetical protein